MYKHPTIHRSSVILLQIVTVLIGIGALAFLLLEPHFEGRNANATFFEIYFNDFFLVYAYTASIAFFTALYQVFKILGYIGQNKVFSLDSVKAFRTIKYCSMIALAFVLGAETYLSIARPGDDIAGGVFMGLLMIVASGVSAIVADVFEKITSHVYLANLSGL